MRDGAIAHRFGSEDLDAVHAAKLKAVQDIACQLSAWMSDAVDNDLDIGDPAHRWAMFVNGITDDLQQARTDAADAGIDTADIDEAEKRGSTGVSWDHQPAHRRLGRLEHLSEQLYHAENHATEALEQIQDLTRQLEIAHAAIDALGDHLTRNENALRSLLVDLVDADWQGPVTGTDPGPRPPLASLNALRQVNATLVVANLLDTVDITPTEQQPTLGRRISSAVDAALPQTDSPAHHDQASSPESTNRASPTAEPEPGVDP
ncbi:MULTISPECIES: hypothetical protein [unclassified Nocardia]|uniref:hypothetical protein n=1 Tax=unclassified Nocardia TaxID=2637762 RepID=UPI0035DD8F09